MIKKSESHIIASIGTLLTLLLIFLLLWWLHMDLPEREEDDEGIEIAFGYEDTGGGVTDVSPTDFVSQQEQTPAPSEVQAPTNNEYITQETEETLETSMQAKEEALEEVEEEEQLVQTPQEEETPPVEEPKDDETLTEQRQDGEAIDSQVAAIFGKTNSETGSNGDDTNNDDAEKGITDGGDFSGDITYESVTGSKRHHEKLVRPEGAYNDAGYVELEFDVNQDGNVIAASIRVITFVGDDEKGTLRNLAREALKKAKFVKSDVEKQRLKIKYIFNLN